jgi:hypothetical protein
MQGEPFFTATLEGGAVIDERTGAGFQDVLDSGFRLREFIVDVDGFRAGVRLPSGELVAGDEVAVVKTPDAPLRLVYYKTMGCESTIGIGTRMMCDAVTVGWQATVSDEDGTWRNVKLGIRLFPHEQRWVMTEAI